MSENPKRGRPRGSSQYREQDDGALECIHKLVVSDKMPVMAAARKVVDEMKLPGANPVERLRHAYPRRRDEIAARIASRTAAQRPQAQPLGTALSKDQIRMLEEGHRHAMSPEAQALRRFVMSPDGQAQLKRAQEDFERAAQMGLLPSPRWP